MATTAEKLKDKALALDTLERYREEITSGRALLLISQELGKGMTDYLRISLSYQDDQGKAQLAHFTWAIAKQFGYTVRDRSGYWYLAISGYGYSKPDEIARDLASFYKIDRVRYETI